jgi:hypothetical protein
MNVMVALKRTIQIDCISVASRTLFSSGIPLTPVEIFSDQQGLDSKGATVLVMSGFLQDFGQTHRHGMGRQ